MSSVDKLALDIVKYGSKPTLLSRDQTKEVLACGKHYVSFWLRYLDMDNIAESAAELGDLDIIKYLYDKNISCMDESVAASAKNVETLKFLRSLGCEWNYKVYTNAIRKNDVEMFNYALMEECPRGVANMPAIAAEAGNIEMYERVVEVFGPARSIKHSANLEMFKHIANTYPSYDPIECAVQAASTGRLDILEYLRKDIFKDVFLESNNVETVKWFIANGYEFNTSIYERAAIAGNLDIIKYGIEHKYPYDMSKMLKGTLDVLKLVCQDYRLTEMDMSLIMRSHDPNKIAWLHTRPEFENLPKPINENIDIFIDEWVDAYRSGIYEIEDETPKKFTIKLIQNTVKSYIDQLVLDHTICGKPLTILNQEQSKDVLNHGIQYTKFLYDYLDKASVMTSAVELGDVETIKYLLEKGCECDTNILNVAANYGNVEIFDLLAKKNNPTSEYFAKSAPLKGECIDCTFTKGRPDLSNYLNYMLPMKQHRDEVDNMIFDALVSQGSFGDATLNEWKYAYEQ